MIETTEPAEASISVRIEGLARQYQRAVQARNTALQDARAHSEEMLKILGAIEELTRLKQEIWGGKEDGNG